VPHDQLTEKGSAKHDDHVIAEQVNESEHKETASAFKTGGSIPPVVGDAQHDKKSASDIAYEGGEHDGKKAEGHEGAAGAHDEHSVAEKLEHWAHEYSKGMHAPHIALEGLEKFAHLVGELGAGPVHHFLDGAGGKLCKGTLSALAIPMAIAHAKEYAEKAHNATNSTQATYYWIQAVCSAGAAIPEIGLAFTFVSEMLQVSEGKGLVYEYLVKNIEKFDGNTLRANADVVFANHTFVSDMTHETEGASAMLNLVQGGYKSREEAFAAVRQLRADSVVGKEDYAITQDPSGGFAVHTLASNQPLAFDMDDKRELESAVLKHENKFNIIALVAEDGTWGKVEKVQMDTWARWDVKAAGKL